MAITKEQALAVWSKTEIHADRGERGWLPLLGLFAATSIRVAPTGLITWDRMRKLLKGVWRSNNDLAAHLEANAQRVSSLTLLMYEAGELERKEVTSKKNGKKWVYRTKEG